MDDCIWSVRIAPCRTSRQFAVLFRRFSSADSIPTLKDGCYGVGYQREWRKADLWYCFSALVCFRRRLFDDLRSELGLPCPRVPVLAEGSLNKFGLTLLISILLFAALFFVLVGSYFVGWFGTEHRLRPIVVFVWKAIQWPAAILFVTMSCSAIYYCGPDLKNRHWHWMTPGSALGAFVWIMASLGFRMYLHFVNNYSATYGSLGAVMILLLWLYVSGLAYLLGGTINAQIQLAAWRGLSPILPFLPSQIRR
jgi:hypothetical protein